MFQALAIDVNWFDCQNVTKIDYFKFDYGIEFEVSLSQQNDIGTF